MNTLPRLHSTAASTRQARARATDVVPDDIVYHPTAGLRDGPRGWRE